MKPTNVLALCALLAITTSAAAQDINPPLLQSPKASQVTGRHIDVLGLLPGMAMDEAKQAFADFLGTNPDEATTQTRIYEGSVEVVSAPYTEWLHGTKGSERLEAQFSGLSSGNQLVLVRREAEYRNTAGAPLFDAFVASSTEKYGEPSFRKDQNNGSTMMWTYKNGLVAACDPSGNPQCLDPESAITMLDQSSKTFDVIISATLLRARGDKTRLSAFRMRSTDLSIKQSTQEADEQGLRPALVDAVHRSIEDAVVPDV